MGNNCCGNDKKSSILSQNDIGQSALINPHAKINSSKNHNTAPQSNNYLSFEQEITPQPYDDEQRKQRYQQQQMQDSQFKNNQQDQQNQQQQMPNTSQLSIIDFEKLFKLGQGAFGQVILVRKKDTGEKLAMKYIPKIELVKSNLVERSLIEKKVLKDNKCPFIVDLKYSFQSNNKIYYLMEYVPGGQLFEILMRVGKFNEQIAKFIIAEVILGIESMHTVLSVIYRDLKPENLLLTLDGHIKIADFGLSKIFKDKNEKTFTFAGTPEYLAPEIILNKGHTKDVDLWCIGIFLYELLAGQPPFTSEPRNLDRIQAAITRNKPIYPKSFSKEAKSFIQNMLQTEPSKRLGAQSFSDIKNHPFFSDINFDDLQNLKVESPLKQFVNLNHAKKQQFVRPKAIQETPVNPDLKLPHIKGISYNPTLGEFNHSDHK